MAAKSPEERFDPDTGVFITRSGKPVKFRPIGPGAIDLKSRQFKKLFREPSVPMIEVNHGKGRVSEQADYSDENYLAAKQRYDSDVNKKVIEWLLCTGVDVDLPHDFEANPVYAAILEIPEEFANEGVTILSLTTMEKKYAYINSLIDAQDYSFALEAIVGASGVTQLGLKQAAEDF